MASFISDSSCMTDTIAAAQRRKETLLKIASTAREMQAILRPSPKRRIEDYDSDADEERAFPSSVMAPQHPPQIQESIAKLQRALVSKLVIDARAQAQKNVADRTTTTRSKAVDEEEGENYIPMLLVPPPSDSDTPTMRLLRQLHFASELMKDVTSSGSRLKVFDQDVHPDSADGSDGGSWDESESDNEYSSRSSDRSSERSRPSETPRTSPDILPHQRKIANRPNRCLASRQLSRAQEIISGPLSLAGMKSPPEGPLPCGWERCIDEPRNITTYRNTVTHVVSSHMPGTPTIDDIFLDCDDLGYLPLGWEYCRTGMYYFDHVHRVKTVQRPNVPTNPHTLLRVQLNEFERTVDDHGRMLPEGWERRLGRFGISFYVYKKCVAALGSPWRDTEAQHERLVRWRDLPEL